MKLIKYIAINTGFMVSLIAAIYGIKWAENIAVFYIGFATVVAASVLVNIGPVIERKAVNGFSVSQWINLTFDIICLAVIVGIGWIWCGIGYTFYILIINYVHSKVKEQRQATNEGR